MHKYNILFRLLHSSDMYWDLRVPFKLQIIVILLYNTSISFITCKLVKQ